MDISPSKAALAFGNFSPVNHRVYYRGFLIDSLQPLQEIPLEDEGKCPELEVAHAPAETGGNLHLPWLCVPYLPRPPPYLRNALALTLGVTSGALPHHMGSNAR